MTSIVLELCPLKIWKIWNIFGWYFVLNHFICINGYVVHLFSLRAVVAVIVCSCICNYLCNQRLSPLTLWVRIPLRWGVLNTTLCDQVCQWLEADRWFSPGTPDFLHQWNWPPWYSWNIVESGIKHHNPNHLYFSSICICVSFSIRKIYSIEFTYSSKVVNFREHLSILPAFVCYFIICRKKINLYYSNMKK
jgi:hypothetical protein